MELRRRWCAAGVIACAVWTACGSDDPGGFKLDGVPDGGDAPPVVVVRDAGPDARADAAMDATVDAGAVRGPMIEITSPGVTTDPLVGPVLTGPSVDVHCEVRQRPGGGAVDPTKVSIAAYAAAASMPAVKVPAVLKGADLFVATVPLEALPTGRVRFECSAAEVGSQSAPQSVSSVETFVDGGPVITFSNLNEMSVIARGKDFAHDLVLQFKVDPSPLAANDTQSAVRDVKLFINEGEVSLAAPSASGEYKKELDFLAFFSGAPIESFTVAVIASSTRAGVEVRVKKQLIVRVDGEGPTIVVKSPTATGGQPPIVGGTVAMQLEISDALAGVASGSDRLYALILYNGMTRRYGVAPQSGTNAYGFTFEASSFSETSDIVAQIHAFDRAGNESVETFAMRLDTVPPWVSLDAPELIEVTSSPRRCSAPYDPLGKSPRDGEVVQQLARFRAFVWERGIRRPGATEIWISGVRDDSVQFYAQDDPSVALIIDADGDGVCDSINNAQTLGDRAPFATALAPVLPGGTVPPGGSAIPTADPAVNYCSGEPAATTALTYRCDNTSEMLFVPAHTTRTSSAPTPVVYAHAVTASGVGCTGVSFDMSGVAGWTCVAAAARDRTGARGNLGVSQPLRVCRSLKAGDCGGLAAGAIGTPPAELTCTDGCTFPTAWSEWSQGTSLER